ncbi:hypothetical protein CBL_09248 [Carabus blaptoides fortunei]
MARNVVCSAVVSHNHGQAKSDVLANVELLTKPYIVLPKVKLFRSQQTHAVHVPSLNIGITVAECKIARVESSCAGLVKATIPLGNASRQITRLELKGNVPKATVHALNINKTLGNRTYAICLPMHYTSYSKLGEKR